MLLAFVYLFTLRSEIPAVLLVRRENTLASVLTIRSDLRLGVGDEGGVVSEDVAASLQVKGQGELQIYLFKCEISQ